MNDIVCQAAQDFLPTIQDANLIIADPPYGIGYEASSKTRIGGTAPRIAPADFGGDVFDSSWLPMAFDALHPDGAMYLFTRWDVMGLWLPAIAAAGFKVVQRIVWDKAHWGAGNLSYYGSQLEDILFCVKPDGSHKLNWTKRQGNLWRIGRGRVMGKDGGGRHATQKPTDLFAKIIWLSSMPGDFVVDPFAGSGASMVAAQREQRRFAGCDIDPVAVAKANEWLLEQQSSDERCISPLII